MINRCADYHLQWRKAYLLQKQELIDRKITAEDVHRASMAQVCSVFIDDWAGLYWSLERYGEPVQLTLNQFGLSKKKIIILGSFAAVWIGLQVSSVVLMLNCDVGTDDAANYLYDCLRDIERLRVALTSIIQFLLELSVAVFLIYCIFEKHRQSAIAKVVVCLSLVTTIIVGSIICDLVIQQRLAQASDRATPVISAIWAYSKKEGHPPETLQKLVPDYIAAIPQTGLGMGDVFLYGLDEKRKWSLFMPFLFSGAKKGSLVYRADANASDQERPNKIKNWAVDEQ